MKKYKRLTKPNRYFDTNDGEHDIILEMDENRYEYPQYDYVDICEKLNRLKELEDKIENGTLIELPCKVGDKFYFVEKFWQNDWFRKGCFRWEILEYTITSILINGNSVVLYVNNDEDIYGREFTMYAKADGTFEFEELVEDYCFFNKAEAEKKLKELQGKYVKD